MDTPLYPEFPLHSSTPCGGQPAFWVGPRHLAGDGGRLYDVVADTLAGLGWTSLTIVRGRHEPDEAPEDRQVLRSTALHISPDALRWAQWGLADEPFHLGELPIAWQVSARAEASSPLAQWSACFTRDVPGEAVVDFLVALDASDQPAVSLVGSELVLDAVAARDWFRDIDQPQAAAMDPMFTSHISLGEVPPLIQDADPRTLSAEAEAEAEGTGTGTVGRQAWAEPALGTPCLWAASFAANVPHDLVAVFAASLSSTAPVLRRVLPEAPQERLLRATADWHPALNPRRTQPGPSNRRGGASCFPDRNSRRAQCARPSISARVCRSVTAPCRTRRCIPAPASLLPSLSSPP